MYPDAAPLALPLGEVFVKVSQGRGMFYKAGEVFSMQGDCPVIAVPPSSLLAPAKYEKLGLQRRSRKSCCTLICSSYFNKNKLSLVGKPLYQCLG